MGRRAHNDATPVRADAHGDHVLSNGLPKTDPGIEALFDDIRKTIIDGDPDMDVGILP